MSPPPQRNTNPAKIYLLPNLMTAGNLIFGFLAVLKIFDATLAREKGGTDWAHTYLVSIYCILAACVFDLLDGRLARLGGKESPFGREFDSLADIVSFGVAPALLVFKIVLHEIPHQIGWLIAGFYLLCGALRLARIAHDGLVVARGAEGRNGVWGRGRRGKCGFAAPALSQRRLPKMVSRRTTEI